MRMKKVANVMLAVFFTILLLLTIFAEDLYCLTLPKVVTEKTVRKAFPVEATGLDGQTVMAQRMALAIPEEALDGNEVYVVTEGEEYFVLTKKQIEIGETLDGFVEVTKGLFGKAEVVIESDRELWDGCRVVKTEWNDAISFHMARKSGQALQQQSADWEKRVEYNVFFIVEVLIGTIGICLFCKEYCKNRLRWLKVPILLAWCVLVCFFFKACISIPGEWIPEKLIDWNGWLENRKKYPLF